MNISTKFTITNPMTDSGNSDEFRSNSRDQVVQPCPPLKRDSWTISDT